MLKITKLILFFSIAITPALTFSQVVNTPAAIPFGGPSVSLIPCPCSPTQPTFHVTYFDKRTKRNIPLVVAPPYSKIYLHGNFTPGVEATGTYNPGGPQCLVYSGDSCKVIPAEGAVNMLPGIGTAATQNVPVGDPLSSQINLMVALIALLQQLIEQISGSN